jgi:hypothetical protein
MKNEQLLTELLGAETEQAVLDIPAVRDLLNDETSWVYLGGMPNNQSIVQTQQSTAPAALVEKVTNGIDAILLKYCKTNAIGLAPKVRTVVRD